MTESEILERLVGVMADFFDEPDIAIGPSTTADDVEAWDSLANVELMIEVEQAFGVRFRTGEVAALGNVGDLVALIGSRVGEGVGG